MSRLIISARGFQTGWHGILRQDTQKAVTTAEEWISRRTRTFLRHGLTTGTITIRVTTEAIIVPGG